jgi:hypothetical protein
MPDGDKSDPMVTPTEAPLTTRPKPKRKRKVSRELKRADELDRAMAKVSSRLSKAAARGFNTYREERDRSAEERRDGAFRDVPENVARSAGNAMRVASRAPLDFAKTVNSKPVNKRMRKTMRAFLRPFSR